MDVRRLRQSDGELMQVSLRRFAYTPMGTFGRILAILHSKFITQ